MSDFPYAEVAVALGSLNLEPTFHYQIPEEWRGQVRPGHQVLVPLGPRKVKGVVIALTAEAPVSTTRPILELLDPEWSLPEESLALAKEMAQRFLTPVGAILELFLPPPGGPRRRKRAALAPPDHLERMTAVSGPPELSADQEVAFRAILAALSGTDLIPLSEPAKAGEGRPAGKAPRERIFLLHGVTGSGKTEIYLRAVQAALENGRQSIVLVPEIALTPQLWERFLDRFPGRVALLHSGLGQRERYEEWQRVKRGEADVVLGVRSAVFAPVTRLGLVVVDEEHEPSFKQEETPRYHAREVAIMRARWWGAPVILGSATPSLESFAQARSGSYRLLELPRRIDDRPLPPVQIVDMRQELADGNRSIFSRVLREKIEERLRQRQQVILFLNRRGHSTFVLCRECGYVARCPHCDISLTYHQDPNLLNCHYCGYATPAPDRCPRCGSPFFRFFGAGTEKVEREVARLFPQARALRLDLDTTGRVGSHQRILGAFAKGDADILIGTQMVAKGLDLPRVTLVGVVTADTLLNLPDFRAAERTFQLLTQVAGRTGRGEEAGEVIIQTYAPEHYSIQAASNHDYKGFWEKEMAFRAPARYPPFSRLINIVVSSPKEEVAQKTAGELGALLQELVAGEGSLKRQGDQPEETEERPLPTAPTITPPQLSAPTLTPPLPGMTATMAPLPTASRTVASQSSGPRTVAPRGWDSLSGGPAIEVLGPVPAPLARLRGNFRWQILLKGEDDEFLRRLVRRALAGRTWPGTARIAIDVDPVNLL